MGRFKIDFLMEEFLAKEEKKKDNLFVKILELQKQKLLVWKEFLLEKFRKYGRIRQHIQGNLRIKKKKGESR